MVFFIADEVLKALKNARGQPPVNKNHQPKKKKCSFCEYLDHQNCFKSNCLTNKTIKRRGMSLLKNPTKARDLAEVADSNIPAQSDQR